MCIPCLTARFRCARKSLIVSLIYTGTASQLVFLILYYILVLSAIINVHIK